MAEQTSVSVGTLAARLLGGRSLKAAEAWLYKCAADGQEEDAMHALTLLGAISSMRIVAGSALTQRPDKGKKS